MPSWDTSEVGQFDPYDQRLYARGMLGFWDSPSCIARLGIAGRTGGCVCAPSPTW
jgi:hypothetical protein